MTEIQKAFKALMDRYNNYRMRAMKHCGSEYDQDAFDQWFTDQLFKNQKGSLMNNLVRMQEI